LTERFSQYALRGKKSMTERFGHNDVIARKRGFGTVIRRGKSTLDGFVSKKEPPDRAVLGSKRCPPSGGYDHLDAL
jgi:hypothetical protein